MSEMKLPTPVSGRCPDCNILVQNGRCPRCGQRFERLKAESGPYVCWNDLHGEAFYKAFDETFGLKPLEERW